jgi:NitT/TauT family transport system ATP-binding protein
MVMNENGKNIITELRDIDLMFSLPGGRELKVLDNINLQIRDGEVVCLLGPSGCGKTTLLRVLAGLLKPTVGEVKYKDQPIRGFNPAVSLVFQSFALFPWLTVEENIEEVLKNTNLSVEKRRKRVRQIIDMIGLEGFEDTLPRELSGGMKQRVSIARALVVEPEVLCLDEPFSQVDALTAESLRAELLSIWMEEDVNPKSIFMVSHDIKEVVWLATKIVILGNMPGKVLSVLDNPLPYPRDYRDPTLVMLQERIYDLLAKRIMPDEEPEVKVVAAEPVKKVEAVEPTVSHEPLEALPPVQVSQIIGLLEMLDDRGGEVNLFAFANELGLEFGHAIAVAKAAEMLDFVDTPRQRVLLMPLGRDFLRADINERKVIWGKQLLTIRLFQIFKTMVELVGDDGISEERVVSEIEMFLPSENANTVFEFLASWGQYGELFRFDPDGECLVPFKTEEDRQEEAAEAEALENEELEENHPQEGKD